jgi:hypothetical protein
MAGSRIATDHGLIRSVGLDLASLDHPAPKLAIYTFA